MRKLKFQDAGKASKILKKLELRIDKDTKVTDIEALGASLFLKLAENYSTVQDDIADFMSGLLEDEGITKKEFLELDLNDAIDYFMKLKDDEGLLRFFNSVQKLSGESN